MAARLFVVLLLPSAIVVGGVLALFYETEVAANRALTEGRQQYQVDSTHEPIVSHLRSAVSDLLFLSRLRQFEDLFEGNEWDARVQLAVVFLEMCETKGIYDQIRFLDETGTELIRVNFNGGDPYLVLEEQLQSKGHRYYFRGALALERGEVFVSPLDLNVEQGEIEKPHKPVIRFATPIFDGMGQRRGVLVVNYLAAELLEGVDFGSAKEAAAHRMLLNSEGFWLKAPRPEDEWGFMYGNNRTFGKSFPEPWKRISSTRAGQFRDRAGLFSFTTVCPLVGHLNFPNACERASERNSRIVDPRAQHHHWKIVSHVPPHVLSAHASRVLRTLLGLYAILCIVLGIASLLVTRATLRRRTTEASLRESEARTRAIVETAADGIVTIDECGIVKSFNSAAQVIFGYAANEVVGKSVNALMPSPDREQHDEYVERYLRTDEAKVVGLGREVEGQRKNGTTFPMHIAVSEVRLPGKRLFTGIVCDITERKRAEQVLREAKDAAEAASRAKGEFLANMSHEIRTPMTAILGFAENLLDAGLSEVERFEAIRTIKSNGETLLQIINDILDLSKIEAQKLAVECIPCSPLAAVEQVASLMRVRATEKNLALDIEHAFPLPDTIQSDPVRLQQILINLVGNAIKFTKAGGVQLVTRFVSADCGLTAGPGVRGKPNLAIGEPESGIDNRQSTIDNPKSPMLQFDVIDTGIGLDRGADRAAVRGVHAGRRVDHA